MMNKTMKQYKGKVLKAMMMLSAFLLNRSSDLLSCVEGMDDALRHELGARRHCYTVFLLF